MAGASVWALATVWAQAAVLSYKANVTLTGTIVAEAIVAAGVDVPVVDAQCRVLGRFNRRMREGAMGRIFPNAARHGMTHRPMKDLHDWIESICHHHFLIRHFRWTIEKSTVGFVLRPRCEKPAKGGYHR